MTKPLLPTKSLFAASLFCALLTSPTAVYAEETLAASIAADYESNLEPLFKHFHANPELSNREFKTAERLASEIRALGYDVSEGVGETGIVAVLENGDGPTVLIRADMDGLPVEEQSGLSYASKARQADINGNEFPVMHACGHDVHITALVGTARQMVERRSEWSGTLVLIGQPAEERISGAKAMMEDGLYSRFPKPDYALAFHVIANMPAGKIAVRSGATSSGSDSVDIIVHGVGTHGAHPHRGIDPVLVASQIVVSLQSIVSRSIDPLEPGVITVGSIHGGTKHNIIGNKVKLELTVRSDSLETRQHLLDGIERVAKGVAQSLGVPDNKLPEVMPSKTETTPPTINDDATTQRLHTQFTEHFGDGKLVEMKREGMGAEDFAYFVAADTGVKGVYFGIGGTSEKDVGKAAANHSPFFKAEPKPSITAGVEASVVAAMTLLSK